MVTIAETCVDEKAGRCMTDEVQQHAPRHRRDGVLIVDQTTMLRLMQTESLSISVHGLSWLDWLSFARRA